MEILEFQFVIREFLFVTPEVQFVLWEFVLVIPELQLESLNLLFGISEF